MLSIDPADEDDEDEASKTISGRATPVAAAGSGTPVGEGSGVAGAEGAAPAQEGNAPAAEGETQHNTSGEGAEAVTPKV